MNLYNSLPNMEQTYGKPKLPGIRNKIYYTPKKDIVNFPKLVDVMVKDSPTIDSLVTYSGDFEFAVGTGFRFIEIDDQKSPVTAEAQGEKPSRSSLNKAAFTYPGTNKEATAFAMLANNGDFVYLIQQRDGQYRVLGNEMYQTTTKVSQSLGDSATSEFNTKIEVEITDLCPAPFYEGEIPLYPES